MGTKLLDQLTGQPRIPILSEIEDALDGLGLMRGDLAPVKRFVVGAGVIYVVMEAFRPSLTHGRGGNHRPWVYTQGWSEEASYVPWWGFPLAGGILLSVFI
jgi:hypothetical protein